MFVVTGLARADVDEDLVALRAAVARQAEIELEVERAWPGRDRLSEEPVPEAVLALSSERRAIEARVVEIVGSLARATDSSPLLDALAATSEPLLAEPLVAALAAGPPDDARFRAELERLATVLVPSPRFLTEALAATTGPGETLFDIGRRDVDAAALGSAVARDAELLPRLLDLCEDESDPLARAALRALDRIDGDGPELARLAARRLSTARTDEIRAAIIVFIGRVAPGAYGGLFRGYIEREYGTLVRSAALEALARAGAAGEDSAAVAEEIRAVWEEAEDVALRRASLRALGTLGSREAVPLLIERLSEPVFAQEARRSLRRITDLDFGDRPGRWERWWRAAESEER